MSEETNWQTSNERYLATALAWLRDKLERRAAQGQETLAIPSPEPQPAPAEPQPESGLPLKRKRSRREPVPQSPALLPSPTPSGSSPDTAQPASELPEADSQASAPPALIMLARRLGLSPFEREVLLLCAAMELDTSIASLCARAQADPTGPYPTFALALTLFEAPAWDALSPERPLRYWRLIEISQPGGKPLTTSPLRADERIVSYLKGLNYLDDRLAPLLGPLELPPAVVALPPSQQSVADSISSRLKQAAAGENLPVIQLLGTDAPSKQLVAAHAADALGLHVYRLPAALLPTQAPELETLARLWQRESQLLPLALYLDGVASEADAPQAGTNSPVNRLLSRIGGVVFVDARDAMPSLENSLRVDVAKPTPAEQKEAWAAALGEAAGTTPALLAGQFNLSFAGIQQAVRHAASDPAAADSGLHDRLWCACLASTRPRLDTLAQRIEAKATWEDIVLPPAETGLLRQIGAASRATQHGLRKLGIRTQDEPRVGDQRPVRRRQRNREDHGRRGDRQRAAAGPLSHRSFRRGEQVHRRDRKKPAAAIRCGRDWRRDSVLRRGGRFVRKAQRGERQPRSLRQYRDQLSVAAHGSLRRAGHPGDQKSERAGPGVHAPPALRREFPVPQRRAAEGHVAKNIPAGDAGPRPGSGSPGAPQPDWREHIVHRAERRVPGGAIGSAGDHPADYGIRPYGVAQTGPRDQRTGVPRDGKGGQGGMKMNVHIERLILEGLPVSNWQGPQVRSAIQKELARLLATHGLSDELRGGIAVPRVPAGAMQLGPENQPAKLGHSIAQAVHEGIGNSNNRTAAGERLPKPGGIPR